MPNTKSITVIEHDESEIDGLQQCLDYLSTYEDPPIPKRSPKRHTSHKKSEYMTKPKLQSSIKEMPLSEQDELIMNDASSGEYQMASDGSARSSIFSNHSDYTKNLHVEFDYGDFMDEVDSNDPICTIDNVVTILRKHDRWDPKKVSFVNI